MDIWESFIYDVLGKVIILCVLLPVAILGGIFVVFIVLGIIKELKKK